MPEASEAVSALMPPQSGIHSQTEEASTLKPREAKVAWTRGTDNRFDRFIHFYLLYLF